MEDAGDFVSASWPITVVHSVLKRCWLVSRCCDENQVNYLKLCWFLRQDLRDATKRLKKKKLLARRQLFGAYCGFIIQRQRVSGHSMLCQSVLKHLRHSSSVMKSVKKRGIWQDVLRTLFYHKCFVSQSFLQGCSLTSMYKSVWIFDGGRKRFCRYWENETFCGLLIRRNMLFVPHVQIFLKQFK